MIIFISEDLIDNNGDCINVQCNAHTVYHQPLTSAMNFYPLGFFLTVPSVFA